MSFCFVPSFGIDSSINLGMPRSTFFCGITETIPSLFLGIFSERNFAANPTYFSTFIPVTISIPLIFPFIPHTSPILSLTFYYSPSSIRSSLTLHSSLLSYPFLVISHSSPSSPIPVPVRLHNSKEGLRKKLTSRTNPHLERIFQKQQILAKFLNSLVAFSIFS
jgi:hypothetical protein